MENIVRGLRRSWRALATDRTDPSGADAEKGQSSFPRVHRVTSFTLHELKNPRRACPYSADFYLNRLRLRLFGFRQAQVQHPVLEFRRHLFLVHRIWQGENAGEGSI